MGIFEGYKIKKSIETLLSLQNPATPEAAQAVARLKQIGRPAVPKLLEALDSARNREPLVGLLATFLDNDTLPQFLNALNKASARTAAGVMDVLARNEKYDPNRLLVLFAHSKITRADLEKLLAMRKRQLDPNALLRLLTTAPQEDHAVIFRLLDQVATEAIVPELINRIRTDDWSVRLYIARLLSRFRSHTVRDVLVRLLNDAHKSVRLVALGGLLAMQLPFDVGALCQLLSDPEPAVRNKVIEVLLELLQDEDEGVRQRAVDGLSAVSSPQILRDFLATLKDKEWWVTVRVADALGTKGGAKILEAALTFLKDPEPFIRQCTLEILRTMKDGRATQALVEALKDKEVREHAANALAELGDKRVIPAFLRMLEWEADASLAAIRSLATLGDPQAITPLLAHLQHPEKTVRQEVLRALAVLTNEKHASEVLQAIMAIRDNAEDDLKEVANRTATAIIKRFGQKVMPQSSLVEAATVGQGAVAEHASVASTHGQEHDTPSHRRSGTVSLAEGQEGSATVDVATLEPGVVLADRYRVIRRVGQGGFSTVFLVEDTMVREEVILKILNAQVALDESMIKRFIHELRYARRVTHENVIRIYDFVTLGSAYAISMEYFSSHSLADELHEGNPLALKRGLKLIWDVCRGVSAAHQANVVHRDLKPPNILISDSGVVKIVDFGVAAVTSDMNTRLTRIGTLLGTPTYMAPEQVRSRTIDARTDVYSLGVIMYEVFTGQPPYAGDDMAVLFQHVEGRPTPPRELNPELVPGLEAIILKAMAVEPEQRFQTVEALRQSLWEFSRQKR
jgi:eukaryotic-like serine/threonine-protein kinase